MAVLATAMLTLALGANSRANPQEYPIDPDVHTTLDRTVVADALPSVSGSIYPCEIPKYKENGYGKWHYGPGIPFVKKTNLMSPLYSGTAVNIARLLNFFTITDIHISDKESPDQAIFMAYHSGHGGVSSAYSPVMLYTTQVLDAAVQTINAINKKTPFDFGVSLGDTCNDTQHNELRWYIDCLTGGDIVPSSGTNHLGAGSIDYQKPFRAPGLDASIKWYQALGNHDHFWLGTYPVHAAHLGVDGLVDMGPTYTGTTITNIAVASGTNQFYVGVIDGSTPYGTVVGAGPVADTTTFPTPPLLPSGADPDRYSLTRDLWVQEFSKVCQTVGSGTTPFGHGFSPQAGVSGSACYSFVPKSSVPIKVIVLDDTQSETDNTYDIFFAHGSLDANRWTWLKAELADGDANNQLMIIAAHVPIAVANSSSSPNPSPIGWLDTTGSNGSAITQVQLLAELHNHPNLILWVAGHRHYNTVTPIPTDDLSHPERGFWQVETASLRDFPQQFRTFEIVRNSDNTVSIFSTCVDPSVQRGSPADVSRTYAVAAYSLFDGIPGKSALNPGGSSGDFGSYNVELLKQLGSDILSSGSMQNCGTPIGVLSALTLSGGTLSPGFVPATASYSGTVAGAVTTVTATKWYSCASPVIQMSLNGGKLVPLASGTASAPLALNMGTNTIKVVASASAGSPKTTYTLAVTRVQSSYPDLSALTLSAGSISPQFTAGGTNYSASVPGTVTRVTITPVQANLNDSVTVCTGNTAWQKVISGRASGALSLDPDGGPTPIYVKVSEQYGNRSSLYTVTVHRLTLPVTGPATGADATTATLNAAVDGDGTSVAFQYGPTTKYGATTPWEAVPYGFPDTPTTTVLTGIMGLTPSTIYHYRVAVATGSTIQYGSDMTFVTAPDFSVEPVAEQGGQAAAIPNAQFVSFGNPAINESGYLAFQAVVSGWGIGVSNNHGIWAQNARGDMQLIVRTGQSTSCLSGTTVKSVTFTAFGDPLFNNRNQVAFLATVKNGTGAGTRQAIFATGTLGNLILVAKDQDQAPDCAAGATFTSFTQLVLPDQGGVVFVANLAKGAHSVTEANDQGVWAVDTTGRVTLVAREGDCLVVDNAGASKTIDSLSIFTASMGAGGQSRSFNTVGNLAYKVTFTDGTQNIYRVTF